MIKQGIEHTFPWMNGSPTAVKQTSLQSAAEQYLKQRTVEGIRPKTVDVYRLALQHFGKVVGNKTPVESITSKHIQDFVNTNRGKLSPTSLNMYLRSLRTFFLWAHEAEMIPKAPKIKEVKVGKGLPRYLSNQEFDFLQEKSTPFLADVFWFYRETGCRLREPFKAELKGTFLLVSTEDSKGHEERQIPLNPDLIDIYYRLMAAGHAPKYYTDQFRKISVRWGWRVTNSTI